MMEAALSHLSGRMAAEHGVPVGECYAELRSLSQEIAARVGRAPSWRKHQAVVARRYGTDEAAIDADSAGDREARTR